VPTTTRGAADLGAARRWSMLALGMAAQAAASMFISGVPFLIPQLQAHFQLSLAGAGLLVTMPTVGNVLTLLLWGAITDAIGERVVLCTGLLLLAGAGVGACLVQTQFLLGLFFLLGGMAGASAGAASGRVVIGWFPPERRGMAMGIRQTALPLGVGVASLVVPTLAQSHGIGAALIVPTGVAAVVAVACALGVIDPPRVPRSEAPAHLLANPYRGNSLLQRIHGVSVLLIVPQYVVWTYMLVWLIADRHWSAGAAGALVTAAQVLGAAGRFVVGWWSDRVGSRTRPLRVVAGGACVAMLLLGLFDAWHSPLAVPLMVLANVISVADNGLAFTSVAETAGPYWSGRALGLQNTSQSITSAFVPPVVGAAIGAFGYPVTFLLTALLPAVAVPLVPVARERERRAARPI
jgi:MFS family permease